jgi:hypothetical protein
MVIVVVLPLSQLLIEQVNIVGDAVLVQELIELLVIDAMRALHFAVQTRRVQTDVDVPDVSRLEVPIMGRSWWTHFEFTRIYITPITLRKQFEDLR